MIAGLAFMVNENFDKFIQKFIIDDGDAGAYGGCYKMAVLMTLFVTAYRMGIEPFFFKQMNNENAKKTYAKVTEYFSFSPRWLLWELLPTFHGLSFYWCPTVHTGLPLTSFLLLLLLIFFSGYIIIFPHGTK